jgi:hypothetical protein
MAIELRASLAWVVGTALSETSGIKYMSPSKLKRGRIATQTNFRKFMENCRASLNQQYADTEADWTAGCLRLADRPPVFGHPMSSFKSG